MPNSSKTVPNPFSDEDQKEVDAKLRVFIKDYLTPIKDGVKNNSDDWYKWLIVKPFDKLAVIKGMKDTKLTEKEYESILAYILLRLPKNFWVASFFPDKLGTPITLTAEDKAAVIAIGKEVFDGKVDFYDKYVLYQTSGANFSTSDQTAVDTALKKIAVKYDDAKKNFKLTDITEYVPPAAVVPVPTSSCSAPTLCKLMPLTSITAAEETKIFANLDILSDGKA